MPAPSHRLSHTHIYRCWASMIARCYQKSHDAYKWYGKKGIRVCEKWRKFSGFLEDMGMPPSGEHTIDRLDNSKNYELNNCRWLHRSLQSRNRTGVKFLTHDGFTGTVLDWVKRTGIPRMTIYNRINAGWSVEKILTTGNREKR